MKYIIANLPLGLIWAACMLVAGFGIAYLMYYKACGKNWKRFTTKKYKYVNQTIRNKRYDFLLLGATISGVITIVVFFLTW